MRTVIEYGRGRGMEADACAVGWGRLNGLVQLREFRRKNDRGQVGDAGIYGMESHGPLSYVLWAVLG